VPGRRAFPAGSAPRHHYYYYHYYCYHYYCYHYYYYHYYYYHYYHYYHCYYYCYHYRPLAPTRRGRFLSGRKWAAPSKRAGLRCGK
jgi:hypothetical protein